MRTKHTQIQSVRDYPIISMTENTIIYTHLESLNSNVSISLTLWWGPQISDNDRSLYKHTAAFVFINMNEHQGAHKE